MESLKTLAEVLQTFGGWGVSAVLIVGIIYLYRSTSALLEKRNSQFIEVLRETTALLQQNADISHRVEALLERVERRLDGGN